MTETELLFREMEKLGQLSGAIEDVLHDEVLEDELPGEVVDALEAARKFIDKRLWGES